MMDYQDQMGRHVHLQKPPKRIISLVPSQTEFLVDIGLEEQLVGITKFCIHPAGLKKKKTIIGGTKNFHFDKIEALKPDLIIGNKEENYQEGIERLAQKFPVWMSDIYDLEDSLEMMALLGEITDRGATTRNIISKIRSGFDRTFPFRGTAIYLIWQEPMIAVGGDTFVDDLLQRAGFVNLISKERYPETSKEEILSLKPDFLLLSSEPYPFGERHLEEYQRMFPDTRVKLVDGEMFSWYGSRLVEAVEYFTVL
jgi:ABC-type Fe3+-hydroxamate transport system substrate-binding protein